MVKQSWQVLEAELYPCPLWVPGELHIGGIGLAHGYLGDAQKTTASFITHPRLLERLYRTGDLGRWQADGEIEFLGRVDFQVKVGGFRVELGEIEHALRSEDGIQEVVVQALGDKSNRYLAAWVQPDSLASLPSKDQLKKTLRGKLPEYMVPNVLVFVDTFPVTSNGKLDRKLLDVPQEEDTSTLGEEAASANEVALLALFRKFLRPSVSPHDNFFEVGGSSLSAMQMAVAIRREFGVSLGIGDIISAPTVKGLAPQLASGQSTKEWSPLVTLRREGNQVPIYLVHPAGGQVGCYRGLLEHLPQSQPLYAFQAAGLTGESVPDASLSAMAQRFVQAMRAITGGPYTLGGWSSGGLISFEMARQLVDAADEVDRLILIDTPAPHTTRCPPPDDLLAWFLHDLQLGFDVGALPAEGQGRTRIGAALEQLGMDRVPISVDDLLPIFGVFSSVIQGAATYSLSGVPVKMELIRACTQVMRQHTLHPSNDSDDWGWLEHTAGVDVEVLWADGTHHTLLSDIMIAEVALIFKRTPSSVDGEDTESQRMKRAWSRGRIGYAVQLRLQSTMRPISRTGCRHNDAAKVVGLDMLRGEWMDVGQLLFWLESQRMATVKSDGRKRDGATPSTSHVTVGVFFGANILF